MIFAFLFILWVLFSLSDGKRDGYYYHANNTSNNPAKENLHWLFSIIRLIFFTLIVIVSSYAYPNQITFYDLWKYLPSLPIQSTLFAIALCLSFSFLHNGIYYVTRNNLDSKVYPKRFFDNSTTSTSILEFDVNTRTIMFVIAFLGVTILI